MRHYIAVILAEATSSAPGFVPLYQESFVLLLAASPNEARAKAEEHGRGVETTYRNAAGEPVTWSLKHVVDVAEVPAPGLGDGADLYARHFRDYAAYRAFEPLLSGDGL
ncbi:DUF4288 domain-containing protein [Yinghuangia sp. ASG 101]|uniref:DUF4288 domain-containing protein n=1 Tax=Yinghuangia sp. ASG 101 TaxID=2896848 RepID=UPI001E2857C1|nr:DUF4288 domain-containing protein [Yinghuangia sp. ASG 101]UGQ12972.1 DUF4288 domain-containing protein [Yinghuangia sp. ASG 101]